MGIWDWFSQLVWTSGSKNTVYTYYDLSVSSQNVYVKILMHNVLILGGDTFRKWLGHEGGAFQPNPEKITPE